MRYSILPAVLGLLISSVANAATPTVSQEMLAAASDLVIVGTVKEIAAEAKEMAVKLSDEDMGKVPMQSAQVTVEKVLGRGIAPATQPAADPKTIEVVSFPTPRRLVFGGPRPQLQKDGKYILVLRKIAGSDAWFMSPMLGGMEEATDESVAAAEKAVNPANWPWGETVRDLRLALLIAPEIQGMRGGARLLDDNGQMNLSPQCALAVQNTGKLAIAINTRPDDKCLSGQYTTGKGKVGENKASPIQWNEIAYANIQMSMIIPPGGIALITPSGVPGKFSLPLAAQFGTMRVELSYQSDRIGFADDKKNLVLWKGKLAAKPVDVEVTQNTMMPPPPGPGRIQPPVRMPDEPHTMPLPPTK